MTHFGDVLIIQLKPIPDICCPWQMGLGRNTECFSDHRMSQRRIWEGMDEQERCSKMLKSILKNRTHKWGLDGEQNLVSPWKHDNLSIRWPWVVHLVSSVGCRAARVL